MSIILFEKKTLKIKDIEFTLDWEDDVHTEKKTFLYLSKKDDLNLPIDYLAYPWAFLIDIFFNKFKNNFIDFYDFLNHIGLIDNLNKSKNKLFITTIQSYHYLKFLDTFKKIGIKYVFSPHIIEKDFTNIFYKYNIIIYPYLIYPSIKGPILDKDIFYSFIGNIKYNSERPTEVRTKICNMKHPNNCLVKSIDKWHFDESVYGKQLNIIKYHNDLDIKKSKREEEYRLILGKSLFSLCPLGIGPNSIRLSESFIFNSIPVSISDDLWLPFYLDVNWDNLIVNIKEENYQDITKLNFSKNRIKIFQDKISDFSKEYLSENNYGNMIDKVFENKEEVILFVPWYNITDELRFKEIHKCLKNNLENDIIKKVVFFYEIENENKIDYKFYNHEKIMIIPVVTNNRRDISFNNIVDYINLNFKNELCIISNNDIYFDNTLNKLNQLDFIKYNYFISLTRKNCDNYLDNNNKIWKPHSASQDSWIFRSPLKLMPSNINLGWIQCDNIISEAYHKLGYNVINPHYSINAWHLHKFNNTKCLLDNFNYKYKYKMKKVPLESIKEIIEKSNEFSFSQINFDLPEFSKPNKIDIRKLSNIKKKWKNNLEINNL